MLNATVAAIFCLSFSFSSPIFECLLPHKQTKRKRQPLMKLKLFYSIFECYFNRRPTATQLLCVPDSKQCTEYRTGAMVNAFEHNSSIKNFNGPNGVAIFCLVCTIPMRLQHVFFLFDGDRSKGTEVWFLMTFRNAFSPISNTWSAHLNWSKRVFADRKHTQHKTDAMRTCNTVCDAHFNLYFKFDRFFFNKKTAKKKTKLWTLVWDFFIWYL